MPDPDGENAVLSAILRSSDAELLQDKVGEENGENDNDNNNNVEEGNRKKTEVSLKGFRFRGLAISLYWYTVGV